MTGCCDYILAAQLVIDPPSSQTLPLGANATFTCRTIGRVRWQIRNTSAGRSLAVELPLTGTELSAFAAMGIYATDTLVNGPNTEYVSTLILTTDERNETEVYCRANLNFVLTDLGQPATVTLFGECADYFGCSTNDLVGQPLYLSLYIYYSAL